MKVLGHSTKREQGGTEITKEDNSIWWLFSLIHS